MKDAKRIKKLAKMGVYALDVNYYYNECNQAHYNIYFTNGIKISGSSSFHNFVKTKQAVADSLDKYHEIRSQWDY